MHAHEERKGGAARERRGPEAAFDASCPFVSVVVPARNAEGHVGECIASLLALDYPVDRVEIIVVDNDSTDGTREVVGRFPVILLEQGERRSSYASRNAGIRRSRGEIIAFTDSDCVASRGWLRELVRGCDDAGVGCFAGEIVPSAQETLIGRYLVQIRHMSQKDLLAYAPLPRAMTANLAFRRGVFQRVGPFREDAVSGGDSEMLIRMLTRTEFRVRYNPDSIVLHKHRARLWPLIRQFVRWGWGEAWLVTAYPDRLDAGVTHGLCPDAAKIWRGLAAFIRGEGPGEAGRYGPLMDAIRLAAWNIGLRGGLIYRRCLR